MGKSIYSITGKTIWVAGHTGLVGSALLRRLQKEDCNILTVPRAQLDLTRQQDTEDWIAQNKPDAIILAAAKVGGIKANSAYPAEFMYENLAIAQNVIHGAYKEGVQKLLFLGSSCIYPREAPQPMTEEALLSGALEKTNEAYALAKIAGVKSCEYYRRQYGCDFIAAMPTNLYGPGDTYDLAASHVIPALLMKFHQAKMQQDKVVEIWGSGSALREFLYVEDLADGLIHILQNYADDAPINIGSGEEVTILDLAQMIAEVTGFQGEIITNPKMPEGTPRKILDCSKLHSLGWKASTPLRQGLVRTYAAYVKTQENSRAA